MSHTVSNAAPRPPCRRSGLGVYWVYDAGRYRVRYNGSWLNDLPHGEGVLFADNGDMYQVGDAGNRHFLFYRFQYRECARSEAQNAVSCRRRGSL